MISSNNAKGINYKAGVSAQLKSAVILAGLNADGVTKIFENYKVEITPKTYWLKIQKL